MSPKTNQGVVDVAVESGREYGGADMVEVYVYRPDGVRYVIRTTAGNAEREELELVNPPKKARKPADKSRTKDTTADKSKTPKATKSSTSKAK